MRRICIFLLVIFMLTGQAARAANPEAMEKRVGTLPARSGRNMEGRRPALISIIDDDARKAFKTFAPTLIERKGIPITCAIPTGWVGGGDYMTWDDIEALGAQYEEIEFVMHGHNHIDLGAATLDEALADVLAAREQMRAHGLADDVLVYPYNSTTESLRAVLRPLLRCAFAGVGYTRTDYNTTPLQTYNITRVGLQSSSSEGTLTLSQMQALIDDTIADNGWLVWVSHSYLTTMPMSQIEAMIDYAKAAGMRFVTVEEGLDLIGNAMEVGSYPTYTGQAYTLIDADGVLHSNIGGAGMIVNAEADVFTADSLPSDFADEAVTVSYVTNDKAQGLPGGLGGVLETFRLSGGRGYGYQRLTQITVNQVWERRQLSKAAWGPFYPLTPIAKDSDNRPADAYLGMQVFDTTLGKPIFCKTASAREQDALTISFGPAIDGQITITLDGAATEVAVTAGMSVAEIDAAIRATAFATGGGWTLSGIEGSGVIVFTRNVGGAAQAPSFSGGETDCAGSFEVMTPGVSAEWVDAGGAAA